MENSRFELIKTDPREVTTYFGVDVVFHLAARAGVRASWGSEFSIYTRNNIEAIQRIPAKIQFVEHQGGMFRTPRQISGNLMLNLDGNHMFR